MEQHHIWGRGVKYKPPHCNTEVLDSTPGPMRPLEAVVKEAAIIWGSKGVQFTGTFYFWWYCTTLQMRHSVVTHTCTIHDKNRDPIDLVCYIHYGNLTKKWQWDGGKVSTIHWCFFVFVRLCKLHNRVQESWICTPSVNNISDVLFPCRLGSSRSLPLLWRVKVIGHWLPI